MTSLCFLIKTGEIKLGGSPENNTNYEINFGIGPSQIHHLRSCLWAGKIEAYSLTKGYMAAQKTDEMKKWDLIWKRRRNLADLINTAIEEQYIIVNFEDEG